MDVGTPAGRGRASVAATARDALLAVSDRPSTWLLGLAGFLVRGGWLLILAPIVVLPTAVGLANIVAPLVEDVAFGRPTDELLRALLVTVGVVLAWLVVGGFIAAVAEVGIVRRVHPSTVDRARDTLPVAARVLAVRLSGLVPLALALAWGAVRLVGVGYRELTVPSDVSTPAAYRIAGGAPDAILAIAVTWLFAEIVGAVAGRRVILAGAGVGSALRAAAARIRREPVHLTGLAVTSAGVLVIVVSITGLAAGTIWATLRSMLAVEVTTADAPDPIGATILLVLFVVVFVAGLVLLAVTSAWRAAIWSHENGAEAGPPPNGAGTFGGVAGTRSGD